MKFFGRKKEPIIRPTTREELNAEIKRLKDLEKELDCLSEPLCISLLSPEVVQLVFYQNGRAKLILSEKEIEIGISPDKLLDELYQMGVKKGRIHDLVYELGKSELYKLIKDLEVGKKC